MAPAIQSDSIVAASGSGRHRVSAAVRLLGEDLLLTVWGGSQPHIGSVSITMPRPSGLAPERMSVTSSVYNFYGHKDEAVARLCAERIAAACNKKTVVVSGIHIDGATPEDIKTILKNAQSLCRRIIKQLGEVT